MAKGKCTNRVAGCSEVGKIVDRDDDNFVCSVCGEKLLRIKSGLDQRWLIGIAIVGVIAVVTPLFIKSDYSVAITPAPDSKQGKVISLDSEKTLECGSNCKHEYSEGTSLTLEAKPEQGFKFDSWTGCVESKTPNQCTLKIDGDKQVSVNFVPLPPALATLTITPPVSGGGKVFAEGNIDCGSTCSQQYTKGSQVKISAQPEQGYQFESWTGGCAETKASDCALTMDENKEVGVNFVKLPELVTLTITAPSSSEGRIISTNSNANIECGDTCSQQYDKGASITIAAKAEKGFKFDAWSGACAKVKVGICTLVMDENKEINVTFAKELGIPEPVVIPDPIDPPIIHPKKDKKFRWKRPSKPTPEPIVIDPPSNIQPVTPQPIEVTPAPIQPDAVPKTHSDDSIRKENCRNIYGDDAANCQ